MLKFLDQLHSLAPDECRMELRKVVRVAAEGGSAVTSGLVEGVEGFFVAFDALNSFFHSVLVVVDLVIYFKI